MLSIGKLGPGQQQYYLDTVARGAEEYWTNAKEAPGQWVGQGSARLGLAGDVDGDDLHRVLEHRDPSSRLSSSPLSPPHRSGCTQTNQRGPARQGIASHAADAIDTLEFQGYQGPSRRRCPPAAYSLSWTRQEASRSIALLASLVRTPRTSVAPVAS
ncbi:MAG: relaxase domain-containing protein [Acidimicrobiia bacterium]